MEFYFKGGDYMLGSNRKFLNKVDELEQRSIELARQVKELSDENKELKEIRLISEHNNTVLLNKNEAQRKIIQEITKLVEMNTYNNEKVILGKIKELVHEHQSKTNSK